MRFKTSKSFERSVKKSKKRFPQITRDLATVFKAIEDNPEIGVVIPDDYGIRKTRVASRDMQKGKSGGFRVLYKLETVHDKDDLVATMLFVYAKADREDVSADILESLNDESQEEEDS